MAIKTYPYINAFNAGEISELLYNREDIAKYRSACRVLENAFPLVEGGAKKMPGTYFAGPTIDNNTVSRLVPFQFSVGQGAILELSAFSIRIWSPSAPGVWDLGLVLSGGIPIQLSTPYPESVLFQLDCGTQSADTLWIFHPDYPPACVERLGPSTWQYTTVPPGGIDPVVPGDPAYRGTLSPISTGFNDIGVPILQITQAYSAVMVTEQPFNLGDRVYINQCSGMVELNQGEFFLNPALNNGDQCQFTGQIDGGSSTVAGTILTVSSVSSGTILVGMLVKGANVAPNTIITEYLSGSGGTGTYQVNISQIVVGSTSMIALGGYAYYLVQVYNGFVAIGSISGTVLNITSVISGKIVPGVGIWFLNPIVANGTIITSYGTGTGGIGTYNINIPQTVPSQVITIIPVASESFLPYTGGGFAVKVQPEFATVGDYPACGTFYQGRLCVGGTDNQPTRFLGSVVEDFPNFICDPNADDYGLNFTLLSTQLNQIISMVGTPAGLLLGTAGGVWSASSGVQGGSLTQSSVSVNGPQAATGVGPLQPQLVGDSAVFSSRTTRQVYFFVYDFVSNQWGNYDLTRLNRQITIGPSEQCSGIVQTAYQSEPYPIFWAVRADGQLLGLVFNKQDQVYAWFRVNMQPNGGDIESVAVISGQNEEDMVVVVVNRFVNGSTVRYVEYFYPQELFNQLSNAFFVHCGLTLNLGSAVTITGITNANPATVTAPGHSFVDGEFVQISNVVGMPEINQDKTEAYIVTGSDIVDGTFQLLGVDSTAWGTYISGGKALPVTNTVTGMSYLLGNIVTAVGDGSIILPPTTVTSDSIVFNYYCSKITIGIPYTLTVQPTNPVLSGQGVTTRGMRQKLTRATISLYQSLSGQYGTSLDSMYDINYDSEAE